MTDDWEITKQRKRAQRKAAGVYVSLNKRGEIVMNAAAFRRIDEPANVTLLYDAKKGRVGVKFPHWTDENFFKVRNYGRGRRNRIVRGGRMLKQFGIVIEKTLVFRDPPLERKDGHPMLVLQLDAGEPVG